MSKPYTDALLSAQITEDRTWRIKEISDLKSAVLRGDKSLQVVLLRALVTICYAHWEGYVRFAAKKYLEHVALRRLQYKDLDRQFVRNFFLPRLASLSTSKTSIAERCELIDEILNSSEGRFGKVNEDLVNTKSNLNYEVFQDICIVCGIPLTEYLIESETFIDVVLLKRRNAIAHGEDTMIALGDLDDISGKTVGLMRHFGDALENRAVLQSYKAA